MYIGVGIFLIVVGAILTFALDATSVSGVDINMIGWICMAAGVLAILLSLVLNSRRTTGAAGYSSRRVSHTDPNTGTRVDEVDVDPRA